MGPAPVTHGNNTVQHTLVQLHLHHTVNVHCAMSDLELYGLDARWLLVCMMSEGNVVLHRRGSTTRYRSTADSCMVENVHPSEVYVVTSMVTVALNKM